MKQYLLGTILLCSTFLLLSFSGTNAFFNDSDISENLVLSAASEFPTTPTPTISITPTVTPIETNHIVISEIQIHGGNANEDFVEIYNPTNASIDISGWKLRVKNSSGTESSLAVLPTATIAARGYYLWSNNQGDFEIQIGANISNSNNLSTNNSIALLKSDNTIVDQVAWGTATSQFVEGTSLSNDPNNGGSFERKAFSSSTTVTMSSGGIDEFKGNGFDSNDNATDFILRNASQPQNSSSSVETP